jgi:hypothetical protein
MKMPFKFGSGVDEIGPHGYDNLFEVRKTTGPAQLVIAPATNHVGLMIELSRVLPEPFCILYVLTVPRSDALRGRYQSPRRLSRSGVESFLTEYQDFFERDGRHHIWLLARPQFHSIVYDNHNVLYAYGPIDEFREILSTRGYREGKVRFPVPHRHCYNSEFDKDEDRVLAHWSWSRVPLQEQDEP